MTIDQRIRHLNHRRIDFFRALKLKLAILFFSPYTKPAKNTPTKILVLRMDDKVGDSITATGFLRELKAAHIKSELIVVAGSASASIYQSLHFIDEVVVAKKGILNTIDLYTKLKGEYLFIINTSHILNPRVIFLCALLPAKKRIGFGNPEIEIFTESVKIDFFRDHVTQRYKKALDLAGARAHNLDYELKLNETAMALVKEKFLLLPKEATQIILLNSFAGGKLRNFSRATTEKIVKKLLANPELVVISAANAGDHKILQQWIPKNQKNWLHFPELHTLDHNIALASLCDLIITPDTAWVHIASALKKKLVAVYRKDEFNQETNSVIWAPYKTEYRVIFAPPNLEGIYDINTVDIEKVVEKANELLSVPDSPIK